MFRGDNMNDVILKAGFVIVFWVLFVVGLVVFYKSPHFDPSGDNMKPAADLLKMPPEKRASLNRLRKSRAAFMIVLITCVCACVLCLIIAQWQQTLSGG